MDLYHSIVRLLYSVNVRQNYEGIRSFTTAQRGAITALNACKESESSLEFAEACRGAQIRKQNRRRKTVVYRTIMCVCVCFLNANNALSCSHFEKHLACIQSTKIKTSWRHYYCASCVRARVRECLRVCDCIPLVPRASSNRWPSAADASGNTWMSGAQVASSKSIANTSWPRQRSSSLVRQ